MESKQTSMESKQTKTAKRTPSSASTRDAALRVVLEVVDEKGRGFVPTLERLGQQATCKAFALCDVGIATNAVRDGTFAHRSAGPKTVDAAIAQRLAAALDSAAVKPEGGAGTQTFAVAWATRAAERAAVACSVLRNATAPLMAADVHVALVRALRRSVEASDPRAPLYAQAIAALLCEVELAPEGLSSSENGMIEGTVDRAAVRAFVAAHDKRKNDLSDQLVEAGLMEVVDRAAATRGDATSRLRESMFWLLERLNFLSPTVMARVPPSLVDRLLALMDETRPDPNKEHAMFALDNIIQSHYKRFDEHFSDDAPQYALPPGTLDVLVSPRGLAIFAGLIRRGSCEMVSSMLSVLALEPGAGDTPYPGPYCRAIAGSAVVDAILEVVALDAAGARAFLELIPNRLKATRIHSGFTEPYHGHSEPQPLAAETLLRLIDWGGFANGDRLRPVIAPLVRLLRTTCQDDARPGPDTYDARSFSCGVLVRLAGAKYRLHEVILAEGGVSAVIEVLQHLKLPGSNAVPKLLLKSSMDCMNVLYAVSAAGGLASVQAAIRSAFPSPQDLERLLGPLEENIVAQLKLLAMCNEATWTAALLPSPVVQRVIYLGSR